MSTNSNYSPSSSPPTPPSPLPLSVGPGNQKYPFSPSPSLSPPFSRASQRSSPEISPLLHEQHMQSQESSSFCLDTLIDDSRPSEKWWQFTNCLRWLILTFCCRCCSSLL
ncbi:hypothetical protein J5N97_020240 [Dioscorea zingiberensis]|uniref:Uncharacterized protein n=1 Tax=Dioscorea zingiberensis TaxID=325984 RepID=A0A9D5CFH7_9LILI|nr:hypothetical protein J5N97_020240 [Dioscorea zingiberensis]